MIRAAIYARFSSDLQSDKSIDDQIALCRDVCARSGMAVISTFEDRAVSGAATINRPGFRALMAAAESRLFNVIVIEDVDRLSRDQGDYHAARKRLDFLGITIHTAAGQVGKLDGALRALMGEMFLENLAIHTRRGLDGVVRDGRHAGGRAYGYRPIAGRAGELEIVEAEAEIIRSIFADYIAGKTPRAIAAALNARGVAAPRGTKWNASTINGNYARGGGILLNDIYAGRIVWNKVRMVKDPETGKRISRPNPSDQHRVVEAEHWRIIERDTWNAARAIKTKRHRESTQKAMAPKRAFSGLIKCGACGAGMGSIGADRKGTRLQCSAHRESSTCDNGRRVYVEAVESKVIEALRANLADPALISEYIEAYNAERQRLKRQAGNDRGRLDRRAGEIERELKRLIDAITQGVALDTIVPRIKDLEAERASVAASIASAAEADNVITLHPTALARYRRDVARLAGALASGDDTAGIFQSIRDLVSSIVVHAEPGKGEITIDIHGRLAALCGADIFPSHTAARVSGGVAVARGRYRHNPRQFLPEFVISAA